MNSFGISFVALEPTLSSPVCIHMRPRAADEESLVVEDSKASSGLSRWSMGQAVVEITALR